MLITDQVATAPCTDPVQESSRIFEASHSGVCNSTNDLFREVLDLDEVVFFVQLSNWFFGIVVKQDLRLFERST